MKYIFTKTVYLIVFLGLVFCLGSCVNEQSSKTEVNKEEKPKIEILQKIKDRGKLVATTDYNSINYFVYRGTPMGYQYEMLKSFAKHLGVKLEIIVNSDIDSSFNCLNQDKCDLIALGLTVTNERMKYVDFTNPHVQTRQVLIQRKPENWRKMKTWDEVEKKLIRNPIELGGKTIHIQKNTSFLPRLRSLAEEIGDTIIIVEDPEKEVEQLIKDVAEGKIEFTVSDEHIAMVNEKYYSNIDIHTPVSFPQNVAWAVKNGADSLRIAVNNWLVDYKNSINSKFVYNKYFKNPRIVRISQSQYHSISGGKISRFDDLIKEVSKEYDMDWRLIASLIYQESGFQAKARSWVGAFGLMQLMPNTAKMYGVDSASSLKDQVAAGVKFIKWLDKQLPEEIKKEERIKFILASYNVGIAHVFDARRLAEKNNKDPNIWVDNVDYYLLNKSKPKFYRDDVVKYGYCRGEEPYNFVNEILERFKHYKNVIEL